MRATADDRLFSRSTGSNRLQRRSPMQRSASTRALPRSNVRLPARHEISREYLHLRFVVRQKGCLPCKCKFRVVLMCAFDFPLHSAPNIWPPLDLFAVEPLAIGASCAKTRRHCPSGAICSSTSARCECVAPFVSRADGLACQRQLMVTSTTPIADVGRHLEFTPPTAKSADEVGGDEAMFAEPLTNSNEAEQQSASPSDDHRRCDENRECRRGELCVERRCACMSSTCAEKSDEPSDAASSASIGYEQPPPLISDETALRLERLFKAIMRTRVDRDQAAAYDDEDDEENESARDNDAATSTAASTTTVADTFASPFAPPFAPTSAPPSAPPSVATAIDEQVSQLTRRQLVAMLADVVGEHLRDEVASDSLREPLGGGSGGGGDDGDSNLLIVRRRKRFSQPQPDPAQTYDTANKHSHDTDEPPIVYLPASPPRKLPPPPSLTFAAITQRVATSAVANTEIKSRQLEKRHSNATATDTRSIASTTRYRCPAGFVLTVWAEDGRIQEIAFLQNTTCLRSERRPLHARCLADVDSCYGGSTCLRGRCVCADGTKEDAMQRRCLRSDRHDTMLAHDSVVDTTTTAASAAAMRSADRVGASTPRKLIHIAIVGSSCIVGQLCAASVCRDGRCVCAPRHVQLGRRCVRLTSAEQTAAVVTAITRAATTQPSTTAAAREPLRNATVAPKPPSSAKTTPPPPTLTAAASAFYAHPPRASPRSPPRPRSLDARSRRPPPLHRRLPIMTSRPVCWPTFEWLCSRWRRRRISIEHLASFCFLVLTRLLLF